MPRVPSSDESPDQSLPEPLIERQLAFGYEDAAGHLAEAAARQLPVDVEDVLPPLPPGTASTGHADEPVVDRLRL